MNNTLNLRAGNRQAPHFLFALLTGLLFFQGCTPAPSVPPVPVKPSPQESAVITQPLQQTDQNIKAFELYQHQQTPPQSAKIAERLQLIDTLIQSGDYDQARTDADSLNPAGLSEPQHAQLNLLYAQIRLSLGEAERAIANLRQIRPQLLDPGLKIKYFQARAFALSLTGELLDSAKARMELDSLLTSQEESAQNQRAILETLSLLPDSTLQYSPPATDDVLAGWLALTRLFKQKNLPDFNARLSQWREMFPDHPANPGVLANAAAMPGDALSHPRSVAVILPESGSFAQAGKAIKAGFMAAYNHQDSSDYKPALHFYDSEPSSPLELYDLAVRNGAELIIGPLGKEAIQNLAGSATFNVPVLALNHIPGLEKDNLYQFALSPIDDIEQLTGKARRDGHQKALLLLPANAQAGRITDYFKKKWQDNEGVILETLTYNPKDTDFSSSIKQLLNLDESEYRYRRIAELFPAASYTPRIRRDADVLFLSAYSDAAKAVNSRLDFYQAGQMPVYALPSVYEGHPNPAADKALDKITFCDAPWLFDKAYQGPLGLESLAAVWRQFPSSYLRLIAMGIDAFNLAIRLDDLNARPYSGATGNLSLTPDNRIKRDLACAKFTAGKPEVTDIIVNQPENGDGAQPASEKNKEAAAKLPRKNLQR